MKYDELHTDPETIPKSDMKRLADHIEEYITVLEEVMIIPEDTMNRHGDEIKESLELTKKLIKKLRKGDTSVFKDEEEWENII